MAKGNNFMLSQLEAIYEAKYRDKFKAQMDMLLQMGQDAAQMAAHDELGMGPGRAVPFTVAYRNAMNWIAGMVVSDSKTDDEIWYAKAKIDERLKAIVGEENFAPWEDRYDKDFQGVVHFVAMKFIEEATREGRVIVLPTREAAIEAKEELKKRYGEVY